ncbi:hypothetical protein MRX96_019187 [Rhipicephalus microplus]
MRPPARVPRKTSRRPGAPFQGATTDSSWPGFPAATEERTTTGNAKFALLTDTFQSGSPLLWHCAHCADVAPGPISIGLVPTLCHQVRPYRAVRKEGPVLAWYPTALLLSR